jgi:uncharacterized protein YgfB (UPF0149 family)
MGNRVAYWNMSGNTCGGHHDSDWPTIRSRSRLTNHALSSPIWLSSSIKHVCHDNDGRQMT